MKNTFLYGVLYGSVRSFFMALMATVGIALGVVFFLAFLGSISSAGTKEVEKNFKIEVLSNAEGVRKIESNKAPVILQVNIQGVIGTELLNTQTISDMLVESREGDLKQNRVKAILLNINSPGGTVTDSDGIYRAIKAYKKQYNVPVYAYADGLCASGGMYVACSADKVFASDVCLLGSIGVISPSFMNFSKLIDKVGIEALTISAGKGKDDMNPLRPWKPNEDASYKEIIEYYYQMFVNIVSTARPEVSKENLIENYGAGIFPAEKAKEIGYIDNNNLSREDVLKLLLKDIGIEDQYYQVVQLQSSNWITKLFSSQNSLFKGIFKHKLEISPEIDVKLSGKFLYLYSPQD